MKIGIEAQRIFRKKKQGMDIVAVELIHTLQKIDTLNEYYVFVQKGEDDSVIQETSNFKIIQLKKAPYPYWEQIILPKAIKRYGIQLLHCTNNTAPLHLDIPLLLTLHDIIYLEHINLLRGTPYQIFGNLYRRWNVPHIIKNTVKIITVSECERKTIIDHFGLPPDHIQTIYNGVGKHFQKQQGNTVLSAVKAKYHLPDNYIFYLGNTDPRKNLRGVLRAMSILRKKNLLNFNLVMSNVSKNFVEKIAGKIGDQKIMENILLPGYILDSDLSAIYSMAKLFLYPSLREGFGLPILEAMACGVPVITSGISSMPEVAGKAAYFVNPHSPDEIAAGIIRVLNDESLRKNLIENGLKQKDKFTWENNAFETLSMYKSILGVEFKFERPAYTVPDFNISGSFPIKAPVTKPD